MVSADKRECLLCKTLQPPTVLSTGYVCLDFAACDARRQRAANAADQAGMLYYLDSEEFETHRGPFFTHAEALAKQEAWEVITTKAKTNETPGGHNERYCVNCIGAQAEKNRKEDGL